MADLDDNANINLYEAYRILHQDQRYPTTGDWQIRFGSTITVDVSDMDGNLKYAQLIALHEMIEATLCMHAGIEEEHVSAFDMAYEKARPSDGLVDPRAFYDLSERFGCTCTITDTSEPGDDIHAPYYKQHQFATAVERMLAAEMGVSWNDYEAANLALYEEPPQDV